MCIRDSFNEVIEHNQKIDKKLEDPEMQKELDFIIKKYTITERISLYINPLYLYKKYKNKKIRTKKFYKINLPIWIWIIFYALIILIIISL